MTSCCIVDCLATLAKKSPKTLPKCRQLVANFSPNSLIICQIFRVKCQGPRMIAGIFNIPKTLTRRAFEGRGERLGKTWKCLEEIWEILQICQCRQIIVRPWNRILQSHYANFVNQQIFFAKSSSASLIDYSSVRFLPKSQIIRSFIIQCCQTSLTRGQRLCAVATDLVHFDPPPPPHTHTHTRTHW